MKIGYAGISTADQNLDLQLDALKAAVAKKAKLTMKIVCTKSSFVLPPLFKRILPFVYKFYRR